MKQLMYMNVMESRTMAAKRMLRTVMSVQDIYGYAEPIMQMLREEYGSYDADSLEEVLVEDPFVHRLQARGYEVRGIVDGAALEVSAAPRTPATEAPAAPRAPATRRRTTTTSSTDEPRPATRTKRTPAAAATDENATASATPRRSTTGTGTGRAATPRRTTRTPRASSDGETSEA
jgi:hypothetical protein